MFGSDRDLPNIAGSASKSHWPWVQRLGAAAWRRLAGMDQWKRPVRSMADRVSYAHATTCGRI